MVRQRETTNVRKGCRRAGGRLRGCAPEAGHGGALDHGEHRRHLACAVLRRTTPRAPRLG
eukprot:4820270-Prymnesium_polylepis.1